MCRAFGRPFHGDFRRPPGAFDLIKLDVSQGDVLITPEHRLISTCDSGSGRVFADGVAKLANVPGFFLLLRCQLFKDFEGKRVWVVAGFVHVCGPYNRPLLQRAAETQKLLGGSPITDCPRARRHHPPPTKIGIVMFSPAWARVSRVAWRAATWALSRRHHHAARSAHCPRQYKPKFT